MEKDMEKLSEEKVEASSAEAKEARTHMEEEHMDGAKELTKEERREKEKEDSLESAIIVVKRDIARGSARSWEKGREQLTMAKATAKDSKDIAMYAGSSGTAQRTAGRAKAREKEEHTQWNGNMKKRTWKKKKDHHVSRKHAHGEDRLSEIWEDAER